MMILVRFLILFITLGLGINNSVAANYSQFPGSEKSAISPDRQYSVYNEDHDFEPNHSLFLKSETTGKYEKLLDYERHVDVAWASNSLAFFVNQYEGSNQATCLIVTLKPRETISVLSILKKLESKDSSLWKNHHLFITCKSWMNGVKVKISLDGYGDSNPNGIEYEYEFDVSKNAISKLGWRNKSGAGTQ